MRFHPGIEFLFLACLVAGSVAADSTFERDTKSRGADLPTEPRFVPVTIDSVLIESRSLEWGDYDNDGDLDIAVTGSVDGLGQIARVYRNDAGSFVDIGASLLPNNQGTVEWGDYDVDGDLDLMISGYSDGYGSGTRIFRNDAGTFVLARTSDMYDTARFSTWGDYDGDGDLDALTVQTGRIRLYHNEADTFTVVDVGLDDAGGTAATWLDHDSDGDLDLAVIGELGIQKFNLYENIEGQFLEVDQPALGTDRTVEWGDYDCDGDPDLLMTGYGSIRPDDYGVRAMVRVLRNDDGTFVEDDTGMFGHDLDAGTWGDYDNDGDLDALLMAGSALLYRNDGSSWTAVDAGIDALRGGECEWGDYDGDGDLDILGTGNPDGEGARLFVYRNDAIRPNALPRPPSNLKATIAGPHARLSWSAAQDFETHARGLSYNVRIGSTPGAADLFSGTADPVTGLLRTVTRGNAGAGTHVVCTLPGPGTYYWTVQAIDAGFAGGPFAAEQVLEITSESDLVDVGGPDMEVALFPTVAPADFDLDGDLDLYVADSGSGFSGQVGLFRNEDGVFEPVPGAFPSPALVAAAAWGDADGDGDPDLAVVGIPVPGMESTVFLNDGGDFAPSGDEFISGSTGDVEWGDYDGDGDLDLLMQGSFGPEPRCRIYENIDGSFHDARAALASLDEGDVEWGDYDADGDLDVLMNGRIDHDWVARVFRNDGYRFVDIDAGLTAPERSVIEWGDLDGDSDLDIVIAAEWNCCVSLSLYWNDNGTFVRTIPGIISLRTTSMRLFDFDDNGELDIVLGGWSGTKIHLNHGGQFVESARRPPALVNGDYPCGDFDGDGILDLIVGTATPVTTQVRILRHETFDPAHSPGPPSGLFAMLSGRDATFRWGPGSDEETPVETLTYNLRVGSAPGSSDLFHCVADPASGQLRLVEPGNAHSARSRTLRLPGVGTYYWSVQSVAAQFQGGRFAPERTVTVESVTASPVAPGATRLLRPHPNPFNARTEIGFVLRNPTPATIQVFDLAGRLVRTLLDESRGAGEHTVTWDGRDQGGAPVGSGSYFCRLLTPDAVDTVRLLLVK